MKQILSQNNSNEFVPLDFNPVKTRKQFLGNYGMHDAAQTQGLNKINSLNYSVITFGGDNRHNREWAKRNDKPDFIVTDEVGNKICFIDWKCKNPYLYASESERLRREEDKYMLNKRAFESYLRYCIEFKLPLVIAMAFLKEKYKPEILSFEYFVFPYPDRVNINSFRTKFMEHDKNLVVLFEKKKSRNFYEIEKYFKWQINENGNK